MNIKLNNMIIENLRGISKFYIEFGSKRTVITAENGGGKTTIYIGFLWLLLDKDNLDRKNFEIAPLDSDNQPIKGLVTMVQAEFNFDNITHTFRKERHERVVKDQLRGYETLCWIDEVPKKVGEYAEYIASIMPEDTFKTLTNLRHFSEGIHWKERRAISLSITGDVGTPQGFDDLLGQLNGRSIDEYKKVLAEQKKRHEQDRDEINPRIDEIQRGLTNYAGTGKTVLNDRRKVIQAEIAELSEKRKQIALKEKEHQGQIDVLNGLKAQKVRREATLESDTSGVEELFKEKTAITTNLSDLKTAMAKAEADLSIKGTEIRSEKSTLESEQRVLNKVRDDYTKATSEDMETKCRLCGQTLPKDRLEEVEQKRQELLKQIAKQGGDAKKAVKDCIARIEKLVEEQTELKKVADEAVKEYETTEAEAKVRLVKIEKAIENREKPAPGPTEQNRTRPE